MNGEAPDNMEAEEIDLGEPIGQLARFEHTTSSGLLPSIRRAIQRRSAVAQLTSFTASVPLVVLRELWVILIEQLSSKSTRKGVPHGE